jgi:prepilin-type N-terminal cleavage/methylation domain-containing protein
MLRYGSRGLSFIEIMVVISIISILMVISVPIYTSYATKSKFAEIYSNMDEYKGEMQSAYAVGDQFPSSFSNLNVSTYTAVSTATLQQIYYGISSNQDAGYLLFYTQDLGIPGFVIANSSGSGGNSGRVALAGIITNTGEIRFYCGQWDGSAADVPLDYLPASCQDTNISALIS